ncbi:hypothetical protein ACI1MP_37505 (plasmid) [Kitasatospora griseola]|uniref:hypothetical protein n=1 Tax=Kitasatospora griseola TaxID=2064 RepID=UPI003855DD52
MNARQSPGAPRKITLDQARQLLAAIGVPVGSDGQEGFVPLARGGRSGVQPVKSAEMIELTYQLAGGYILGSRDLDDFPEQRETFRWAVDRAPSHGYRITWHEGSARMYLQRADTPAPTAPAAAIPASDREPVAAADAAPSLEPDAAREHANALFGFVRIRLAEAAAATGHTLPPEVITELVKGAYALGRIDGALDDRDPAAATAPLNTLHRMAANWREHPDNPDADRCQWQPAAPDNGGER